MFYVTAWGEVHRKMPTKEYIEQEEARIYWGHNWRFPIMVEYELEQKIETTKEQVNGLAEKVRQLTLDFAKMGISLLLLYIPANQICQSYINSEGQLIEARYELREISSRKFLIPIQKDVIKEKATPEDLRNYKCKPTKIK